MSRNQQSQKSKSQKACFECCERVCKSTACPSKSSVSNPTQSRLNPTKPSTSCAYNPCEFKICSPKSVNPFVNGIYWLKYVDGCPKLCPVPKDYLKQFEKPKQHAPKHRGCSCKPVVKETVGMDSFTQTDIDNTDVSVQFPEDEEVAVVQEESKEVIISCCSSQFKKNPTIESFESQSESQIDNLVEESAVSDTGVTSSSRRPDKTVILSETSMESHVRENQIDESKDSGTKSPTENVKSHSPEATSPKSKKPTEFDHDSRLSIKDFSNIRQESNISIRRFDNESPKSLVEEPNRRSSKEQITSKTVDSAGKEGNLLKEQIKENIKSGENELLEEKSKEPAKILIDSNSEKEIKFIRLEDIEPSKNNLLEEKRKEKIESTGNDNLPEEKSNISSIAPSKTNLQNIPSFNNAPSKKNSTHDKIQEEVHTEKNEFDAKSRKNGCTCGCQRPPQDYRPCARCTRRMSSCPYCCYRPYTYPMCYMQGCNPCMGYFFDQGPEVPCCSFDQNANSKKGNIESKK